MAGVGLREFGQTMSQQEFPTAVADLALVEQRIQVPGLELAALTANLEHSQQKPILFLHGWMDNAASFLPLMPYLADHPMVALEHAGHGHSQHRPPGRWYHLMDYVADALAAVDALGWDEFYLIGHSLGGAVSTLVTAAIPERVKSLVVIEGLGPLAGEGKDICQRLQRSWKQLRDIDPERLRRYETVDEAVHARVRKNHINEGPARALVERGLQRDGEHWIWRTDPRLNITTPYRFDEDQIRHLMRGIECPCLSLLSDPPTPLLPLDDFRQRLAALPQGRMAQLPGGHHLHMNYPAELAALILEHFNGGSDPS